MSLVKYGAATVAALGAAGIAQFAPPVLPSSPSVGFLQFAMVGLAVLLTFAILD